MTVEIEQLTDFTAIEDAIEAWIKAASGINTVYWEGYSFERERPYILITPISQPTPGQAWSRKNSITESGVEKWQTKYYQPFRWSVQFTAYVDAYDARGNEIRMTAYRYMQNVINRAYIPSVRDLINNAGIASHPQTQTITPNVLPNVDPDKYIHRATLEYLFSGIVETLEKDTDFFTSVELPTINLAEA